MCVCLSVNSSYSYEPIELKLCRCLTPLKTGNKNFFDWTKKKFRNFLGDSLSSGRGQMGMSAFISLTVLTRSSWNFAGVILFLILTTGNKKNFDQTKKILKNYFLKNYFLKIFLIFFEFVGVGRRPLLPSAGTSLKTPPVGRVFG